MKHAPFIAVEGPIGAGKTTLATMLATELQLPVIKEIVDENPFLDKFYQNMDDWSFQLEMFFLCNRFKQLEDTTVQYIDQGEPVISDYHIYKNLIFGERTLKGSKRDKYREIYHILTDDFPSRTSFCISGRIWIRCWPGLPSARVHLKRSLPLPTSSS